MQSRLLNFNKGLCPQATAQRLGARPRPRPHFSQNLSEVPVLKSKFFEVHFSGLEFWKSKCGLVPACKDLIQSRLCWRPAHALAGKINISRVITIGFLYRFTQSTMSISSVINYNERVTRRLPLLASRYEERQLSHFQPHLKRLPAYHTATLALLGCSAISWRIPQLSLLPKARIILRDE